MRAALWLLLIAASTAGVVTWAPSGRPTARRAAPA